MFTPGSSQSFSKGLNKIDTPLVSKEVKPESEKKLEDITTDSALRGISINRNLEGASIQPNPENVNIAVVSNLSLMSLSQSNTAIMPQVKPKDSAPQQPDLFSNLPEELQLQVLRNLSVSDLAKTTAVNKNLHVLSDCNETWQERLDPDIPESRLPGSNAKSLFLTDPATRERREINFDKKGQAHSREIIKQAIENRIADGNLSTDQKLILDLDDLVDMILNKMILNKITPTDAAINAAINAAIEKFSADQVNGLNRPQLRGLIAGLSRDQVNHDWFNSHLHVDLIKKSTYTYEKIEGLNFDQLNKMHSWPFDREMVEGLLEHQLEGLTIGLNRNQVTDKRFSKDMVYILETPNTDYSYDQLIDLEASEVYRIVQQVARQFFP